jgi:hypothetical protein
LIFVWYAVLLPPLGLVKSSQIAAIDRPLIFKRRICFLKKLPISGH